MAHVALHANSRNEFGNGPTRRLRKQGRVPGIVYQPGGPSLTLSLPGHDLRKALNEGRTGVIDLVIDDQAPRPVLVKDWQLHPVDLHVLHVDFQQVDLTVEVEAPVTITLVGQSVGVRDGGVLDQPLREVVVSALPDSLPDHLEIDVTELGIGDSLTVGDIAAPAGVIIVSDPETVVASVLAPTAEVSEEAGEGEEGEAPAEQQGESSEE